MAGEVIVMAVGDICFDLEEFPSFKGIIPVVNDRTSPYSTLHKIVSTLKQSDITFGNLEGVICNSIPNITGRKAIIRMPPNVAEKLRNIGFDALSLANNHIMDLGPEGVYQTTNYLNKAGISYFGVGRNIEEARKPSILKRKGVKFALLSYCSEFTPGTFPATKSKPGIVIVSVTTSYEIPDNIVYSPGVLPRVITTPNKEELEQMVEDIQQAKQQTDFVIVSCHWGFTRMASSHATGLPVEDCPFFVVNYQEDMGRAAINAGADLVVGHHPHRLQGMEVYKGKLICYSLGHLVFGYDYDFPNFGEKSVIVKVWVDPKEKCITKVTLIPIVIPGSTQETHLASKYESNEIITELEKLSKKYGTKFVLKEEEIVVECI